MARVIWTVMVLLAVLLLSVALALVWANPTEITSYAEQQISMEGEIISYIAPADFVAHTDDEIVWLRLTSNQPFSVNGVEAQQAEYGVGFMYEPDIYSLYEQQVVLEVDGDAPVSIQATGDVRLTLVFVVVESASVYTLAHILISIILVTCIIAVVVYGEKRMPPPDTIKPTLQIKARYFS